MPSYALNGRPYARRTPAPRPNQYAGRCTHCNIFVEAEAGTAFLGTDNRWAVRHNDSAACDQAKATAQANRPQRPVEFPEVIEGRYAVPSATGNNDLDFFKVDRPTEGRWEGYVFVKRVVGGHEDIKLDRTQSRAALEAIVAAGPREALARYGQEIGDCGVCGRSLTDEESRRVGIGPICRDRL